MKTKRKPLSVKGELDAQLALSRAAKKAGGVLVGDVEAGQNTMTINLALLHQKAGPLTVAQLAAVIQKLGKQLAADAR